ncbi:MAG: hypothetical protein WBD31_23390, partial [Rubripirellula sp.]
IYKLTAEGYRDSIEQEFLGVHGDLVIAIHLRDSLSRPICIRPANCKDSNHSLDTITGNSGKPLDVSESSPLSGSKTWNFGGNIRLLRSSHESDFYHVVFHPTRALKRNWLDEKNAQLQLDGTETSLLFQYDGKAKVVHQDSAVVIVVGPSRDSVVGTFMDFYPADLATKMKERWYQPFPLVVRGSLHEGYRFKKDSQWLADDAKTRAKGHYVP